MLLLFLPATRLAYQQNRVTSGRREGFQTPALSSVVTRRLILVKYCGITSGIGPLCDKEKYYYRRGRRSDGHGKRLVVRGGVEDS